MKILAELRNRVDVGSLRRRRQIADRHVLDHAATHRAYLGHLKLLSESGLQHPILSGRRTIAPQRSADRRFRLRRDSGFVQSPREKIPSPLF